MIWKKSNYYFLTPTFVSPKSFQTLRAQQNSLIVKKVNLSNTQFIVDFDRKRQILTKKINVNNTRLIACSTSMKDTTLLNETSKINSWKGFNKDVEIQKFFNQCFDKGRLKNFVLWFLLKYGENKTLRLVEQLKNVGFQYASKAGISLGVDDLKIPPKKIDLIYDAENLTSSTIQQYMRGEITGVERFQRLIDTWHRTSEVLKQEVIDHFEATDILNPVYMMAFSGARGNISQVRQLVGMRGLMADPQGEILDFPIRSNFREGLTLTEYIISSYGARKGIVDTALRTANAGYLTRRLVDVAQHAIISNYDCGTKRGIFLTNMKEGNKVIYSLSQRIVGRILARDLFITNSQNSELNLLSAEKNKLASRNEEITSELAFKIGKNFDKVFIRSSLTCEKLICQLCYGWSLGQGKLVSIGEAVGVVAAQSIGEPGTQLTMRTFHTGGVFAGDVSDQIKAPYDGVIEYISAIAGTLIRTPEGKIAFLTKSEGSFRVNKKDSALSTAVSLTTQQNGNEVVKKEGKKIFKIPPYTLLYMRNGQNVLEKQVLAQISSISQKTNATDEVAFTIKAEMEGQFYSKSLGFRERMVGPKLKNSNKLFRDIEFDKIYEAWSWGYAWILSGKIYEFKKPSPLFPILGDLLTTKSYVTQTKWNLNINNTSTYDLFFEHNKRNPINFNNIHYNTISKLRNSALLSTNNNEKIGRIKSYPLQTSNVLFLDLKQVLFKKMGYVLEINKKQPFISSQFSQPNALSSITVNNNLKTKTENSLNSLSKNNNPSDLLFFIKTPSVLAQDKYFQEKLMQKKNLINQLTESKELSFPTHNSNALNTAKQFSLKNSQKIKTANIKHIQEKKYLQQLPHFLQWFPDKYKTQTSGTIIFETNASHLNRYWNLKAKYFNNNLNNEDKALSSQLSLDKEKSILFNKRGNLLINERLVFLKKREIDYLKLFWTPSFNFKVNNLISYSDYIKLSTFSNKKFSNFCLCKSTSTQMDLALKDKNSALKFSINLFSNKKMPFLQINRQGNIHYSSNQLYENLFEKSTLSKSVKPILSANQQFVSNSLLKIQNSPSNSTFAFEKSKGNLSSLNPLFATFKGNESNESLGFNSNNSLKKNVYKVKDLRTFCKYIHKFTNENQLYFDNTLNYISLYQKIHNTTNSTISKKKRGSINKTNSLSLLKENRSLFLLNSLSLFYTDFKTSPYLDENYKEYSSIQNIHKFNHFLADKKEPYSPNFSTRAISSTWHFYTYSLSPLKSFLITLNQIDNNSLSSVDLTPNNNSLSIKKPLNYSNYFGTIKKGWLVVTPQRSFENLQKKIIYPGQKVLNNIHFNTPVFAEYFVGSQPFNIKQISSLSLQNLPNLNQKDNFDKHENLENPKNPSKLNGNSAGNKTNQNEQFLEKFRKNQLQWVKNKKCRFYILENDKNGNNSLFITNPNKNPNSNESPNFNHNHNSNSNSNSNKNIQPNGLNFIHIDINKNTEIDDLQKKTTIGIVFQPVQEFKQMSDFDLKQYTYDYSKTNWNFALSSTTNLFSQLYPTSFVALCPSLLKRHKNESIFSHQQDNFGEFFMNYKTLVSMHRGNKEFISKSKIDKTSKSTRKLKRSLYINQSFDSLCQKDIFRNKFNRTSLLSITPNSFDKSVFKSTLLKNTSKFSVFYMNNAKLMKSINSDSSLLLNKKHLKESDWKNLGLYVSLSLNKDLTIMSNLKILKPKNPKDDHTIISNLLFKSYIQQYFNTELYFKKSLYTQSLFLRSLKNSNLLNLPSIFNALNITNSNLSHNITDTNNSNNSNNMNNSINIATNFSQYHSNSFDINNQNSIFMVSRKPLNLSSFMLSYNNQSTFPGLFNKKRMFKLSYSPISNFDLKAYPVFTNQMNFMLNFYLSKASSATVPYTHQLNEKNTEKGSNQLNKIENVYKLENFEKSVYWNYNLLIKQSFELPCFMFSLAQNFDMNKLKQSKTQKTLFLYNPSAPTLFSQSSIQKRTIQQSEAYSNFYSPFNGELVYVKNKLFSPLQTPTTSVFLELENKVEDNEDNNTHTYQNLNTESPRNTFSYSCMFLSKSHLISYYIPRISKKNFKLRDVFDLRVDNSYQINDTLVKFLSMSEIQSFEQFNTLPNISFSTQNLKPNSVINISKIKAGKAFERDSPFRKVSYLQSDLIHTFNQSNSQLLSNNITENKLSSQFIQDNNNKLAPKISYDKKAHSISLLGDFLMFGDQIWDSSNQNEHIAVQNSGQIIHYNNTKVTIRRAQPIFISPKGVLHKLDKEFIDPKSPVITLSYQRLKTGDIIQGIPKVEQFFEARTTKRGRLFRDSLPSLLKALFKRYQSKMPLELAVRQSFYKIQQIIVDGVQRVYKSQGVTISDKHLEVIVKQMTSKVRILDGAQTGFFPGEVVDLSFVEKINEFLIRKITYEPLVLGITKASLEVDSFLSAASFQQTTKVLSQAAIYQKKDFLKGLKENVILGNLIPAGTGYLVHLDDISNFQQQK